MKRINWLIANGMAAFFDFAVGCLIAALVSNYAGVDIGWWFLLGGIFGLLPDLDFIVPVIRQAFDGKIIEENHHESVFHWPLPIILAALAAYLLGGGMWAAIVGLCIMAHYLHDAFMMGRAGIAWFLRPRAAHWKVIGGKDPSQVEHREWIRNNWLRPSSLSIAELGLGILAFMAALQIMSDNATFAVVVGGILIFSTAAYWILNGISRAHTRA